MSAARPDVAYSILKLDVLKEDFPAEPGDALKRVMKRLAAGELTPIVHSLWSLTETGPAMDFRRAARHIGKTVLAASPLERGRLKQDLTYLVTGGLGGIGCAVVGWLADCHLQRQPIPSPSLDWGCGSAGASESAPASSPGRS